MNLGDKEYVLDEAGRLLDEACHSAWRHDKEGWLRCKEALIDMLRGLKIERNAGGLK